MIYAIIVIILFMLELTYFIMAKIYNIIDSPNRRSSHSSETLLGGGIVFLSINNL